MAHVRKPIEQKAPLAAWATLSRDEAGMSVEEVVDALEARGHSVKAATIRGIEGGSKGASARLRRLLAEVYGTKLPGETTLQPVGDTAAIVAAIDRLTAAVRAHQGSMDDGIAALAGVVGAVLGRFADTPSDTPAERAGQS